MPIADLVSKFRARFGTYTPVVHLLEGVDGAPVNQMGANGAALVTTVLPSAIDMRLARFNAAADLPADITNSSNVSGDLITFTGFAATARALEFVWHAWGQAGADTQATQQFFGEVALGAIVTINADDDTDAATRLTYSDVTGASDSASGVADTFVISRTAPYLYLPVDTQITRIDAIGIATGLNGSTHLDYVVPCFLEVRVIG